jgi:cytochrome c oxidase cbb3-type subunit 3
VTASQVAALLLACAVLAACERERRVFTPPPGASAPAAPRATSLRPGDGEPLQPGTAPDRPGREADDEHNAFLVNQGKRLFRWYNCSGCHGQGGGNMGPALSDAAWLYGASPANVFASIVEGRPNGMPAFGGRIPNDQVWQLVAYVRSLSGQLRKDVAPSRADAIAGAPPENTRAEERPAAASTASATRP